MGKKTSSAPAHNRCELAGQRFGRLLVIRFAGRADRGKRHTMWECRCDCGSIRTVRTETLRNGMTRSCGCLRREASGNKARTHGESKTRLYNNWGQIIDRCVNPHNHAFTSYGGRGIGICDGWRLSFPAFREAVGERPSMAHSLDRINNNSGYTCGSCDECNRHGWRMNCRWATKKDQSANTRRAFRITYRGETRSLREWAQRLGMNYALLYNRLRGFSGRIWTVERAFATPSQRANSPKPRSARAQTYHIWYGMRLRCNDPEHHRYNYYGARGIKVCARWGSFDAFIEDMGLRPSPQHSIDRIDPSGNYEPSNCRWATMQQQTANRRRAKASATVPSRFR